MFAIKGKVVLLTGALGGIGKCFVKELLRNDAKGIALLDINEKVSKSFENEIQKEFGEGKTIFVKVDVTDTAQIEGGYEKTVKHFKQLDIVINNAGLFGEDDFLKCLKTNFVATAFSTNLAFRKYLESYRIGEEGIIVNTASIAGLYPFPMFPAYGPCKQGIITLGRSFGNEVHYTARKIKIMTICPGATDTALLDQFDSFPDDINPMAKEILKKFHIQRADSVASALIEIIKNGKSGSTWVVKDDKPAQEIDFSEADKNAYKYITQ